MTYQVLSSSKVTEADWRYPQPTAVARGLLAVDQDPDHQIYWEEYGNAAGEPVMILHGGPGGGSMPVYARFFDPMRYRIILFDQRGCGKSQPTVASAGAEVALQKNTTDDLVSDILKLRKALAIDDKMHVFGGSWGSTLALVYAMRHPETVQSLILRGIFLGRAPDLAYLYQGNAARYADDPDDMSAPGAYISYPEAWDQYVTVIPLDKRADMMAAYKEIFDTVPENDAARDLQLKAAIAWSAWEGTISSLVPSTDTASFEEPEFAVCFAQIEAHYFAAGLFLPENAILKNIEKIKDIPTYIVHGRFDQVCPLTQAESLVRAMKGVGAMPAAYLKTMAGHSMMERETALALQDIMENMPKYR